MMRTPNRSVKNLLKIVPSIMIVASAFLLGPFPANGQTKSGSLLSRLNDRNTRLLRVSFAYAPSFPVVGQTIRFTDTSIGSPVSWLWDFGDGTTSAERNPTHAFGLPGFHRVTLTEADAQGSKKLSRLLTVVPAQGQATFAFSPSTPAPGQAVQFTDTTAGGPTAWSWNFGDGATSSVKNPSHSFGRAGAYVVSLVATTSGGSRQGSKTLNVASMSVLSSAFTFAPASPLVGQTVQFTDTSTGSPTSWSWNFGDGTTSTAQNPAHAYATAGAKTVTLTATNGSGSSTASRTVTVAAAVAASFTYSPASPGIDQTIQFTDTSTGSPTSWSWNFGDGTTSTVQNPTHLFTTEGAKTVTLTATNASGSSSASRTVTVVATVTASFTFAPGSPAVNQTVQFTDTSTGSPTSWSWNFGDGTTSTAQNPTHAYATAGAKTVTLTATNASGSATASRTVTVAVSVAASFTFNPGSPITNQTVQFTDTSTGSPTSWSWNFGDGTTSTAQNPSHAYATAGAKTVTLTATSGSGSSTASRTVTVAAAVAASFTFSPASPVTNQTIQFTDTSSGSPTSWSWNFGDGTTSTVQNPSHAFTTAGAKTVTLTATSGSGSGSVSRTVTVVAAVAASFTFTPSSPAINQTIQFTDTSTGSPTSWSWNFGDGTTGTAQNPTHAYTTAGSKTVTLTATSSSGSGSVSRTVTVAAAAAASFTFSPSSPAINQTVQFTDTSTGSPTSWSWSFGDGATSAAQNPTHAFTTAGSRTVTLTATGSSGSLSVSQTLTVVDGSNAMTLADRWIDWSGAGVPGGIAQYRDGGANARPFGVSVADYGADATGRTNASTAFANAQSACPAGAYIYIPNGTYLLSGSVALTSNRTWRGQSVSGTIIKFSGGGGFASPAEWPAPTYAANGVTVTAGATKGSRVLTVASTSSFTVGGLAQLTQLTPSWMHFNSANSWREESWFGYDATRLSTMIFTVAAVDSAARTVTLDHPLPMDMTSSPLLMARACLVRGIGFENITFDCTSSTANQVVQIVNATSCWIYGCYFKRMYDRSAWFEECTNITFEHNYSDHGQGLGRNCEGLDFVGNACWCLVQDNVFHSAGYPMIMFGDWQGGCVGNVAAYNFLNGFNQGYDLSTAPLSADDSHGPTCVFNLWEGNVGEIFGNDGYYGSAGYGTYFRNRIWGTTSEMNYADQTCLELTHWSYMYSVVGNVLGTPQGSNWNTTGQYSQIFEASGTSFQSPQIYRLGFADMGNRDTTGSGSNPSSSTSYDTNVKVTLIRHGNFDYVNNAVLWDPNVSSRSLPASLYLTSTPSWWGSRAFPAVGPDVTGYSQDTPASARWAAFLASGNISSLF